MNHFDDIDDDPYVKCIACELLYDIEVLNYCEHCEERFCQYCFEDHQKNLNNERSE